MDLDFISIIHSAAHQKKMACKLDRSISVFSDEDNGWSVYCETCQYFWQKLLLHIVAACDFLIACQVAGVASLQKIKQSTGLYCENNHQVVFIRRKLEVSILKIYIVYIIGLVFNSVQHAKLKQCIRFIIKWSCLLICSCLWCIWGKIVV